ncbi:hypothetical protein SDC9_117497 [bioreactor metagenome]|uniref:Uncharacterized protein n=1 Tax=bioreactor metagenome TaxID=1076179 RepID=A0A645BYX1_9ZZZZ
MIDQGFRIFEQWLDELIEVINLLQLAARVLVELAVARQDVQFLQQINGLAGADFRNVGGGVLLFHRRDYRISKAITFVSTESKLRRY